MIDILIKSYNRPYYLDRCLQSIYRFVMNTDFRIIVLDDGTPKKFLDKIRAKFPEIKVVTSGLYKEKSKYIYNGGTLSSTSIPIEMWVDAACNASEYFVLLEDDIWFTDVVDLASMVFHAKKNNTILVKFFWLGNKHLRQSSKEVLEENMIRVTPNLPSFSPRWYKLMFYRYNRFRLADLKAFLGFNTIEKRNSFYSVYSVAGMLFRKDYFTVLWNDHKNQVDEQLQIYNALKFIKKSFSRKNKPSFYRTHQEIVKTGFSSSATDKCFIYSPLKMNVLNSVLNELWHKEQFDAMENFPLDYSINYMETILNPQGAEFVENWKIWRKNFRANYENFGCNID